MVIIPKLGSHDNDTSKLTAHGGGFPASLELCLHLCLRGAVRIFAQLS